MGTTGRDTPTGTPHSFTFLRKNPVAGTSVLPSRSTPTKAWRKSLEYPQGCRRLVRRARAGDRAAGQPMPGPARGAAVAPGAAYEPCCPSHRYVRCLQPAICRASARSTPGEQGIVRPPESQLGIDQPGWQSLAARRDSAGHLFFRGRYAAKTQRTESAAHSAREPHSGGLAGPVRPGLDRSLPDQPVVGSARRRGRRSRRDRARARSAAAHSSLSAQAGALSCRYEGHALPFLDLGCVLVVARACSCLRSAMSCSTAAIRCVSPYV